MWSGEQSGRVPPEGGLGKARAWRLTWLPIIAAGVWLGACAGGMAPAAPAGGAAGRFAAVREDPPELRAFLRRFPKGADLHIHLTGAVYAETYVRSAAAQGLCVQTASLALAKPPCGPKGDSVPAADLLKDKAKFARLVDSLSMRDFVPSDGFSGHDQFFATFARFGAATDAVGDLSAEVVDRAGHEREQHIELMTTWQGSAARALGRQVGWSDDFAALQQRLVDAGLASAVADARRDIDAAEARRLEVLGCGRPEASPGCRMSVRYIQQVSRTNPPAEVFAQTLLAFMLAQADPRVVGLNFVAPEDDPVALADYDLHMRMLDYSTGRAVGAHRLHAGELTLGLVGRRGCGTTCARPSRSGTPSGSATAWT